MTDIEPYNSGLVPREAYTLRGEEARMELGLMFDYMGLGINAQAALIEGDRLATILGPQNQWAVDRVRQPMDSIVAAIRRFCGTIALLPLTDTHDLSVEVSPNTSGPKGYSKTATFTRQDPPAEGEAPRPEISVSLHLESQLWLEDARVVPGADLDVQVAVSARKRWADPQKTWPEHDYDLQVRLDAGPDLEDGRPGAQIRGLHVSDGTYGITTENDSVVAINAFLDSNRETTSAGLILVDYVSWSEHKKERTVKAAVTLRGLGKVIDLFDRVNQDLPDGARRLYQQRLAG